MNTFNLNFKLWKIGVVVAFFCALADALGVYVAAEQVIWTKVIAFACIKGCLGAALYMKEHPIEQLTNQPKVIVPDDDPTKTKTANT